MSLHRNTVYYVIYSCCSNLHLLFVSDTVLATHVFLQSLS